MGEVFGVSTYQEPAAAVRSAAWYYLAKRLIDFVLAAVLLVGFLPLLAVVAVLIKLDSRGPVFFRQKRVGARRVASDGAWRWERADFTCIKFRTMVHNADPAIHQAYVTALIHNDAQKMDEIQNGCQPLRKLVHDPRITRLGRYLRKFSLDELPQFINVLRGEMSLVGPRPAIGYEVEQYTPWHRGRLNAQPGITGWQQVKARCTAAFDDQVKYDLEYIENQSLRLDLKIMLLTPLEVLRHRGAC